MTSPEPTPNSQESRSQTGEPQRIAFLEFTQTRFGSLGVGSWELAWSAQASTIGFGLVAGSSFGGRPPWRTAPATGT